MRDQAKIEPWPTWTGANIHAFQFCFIFSSDLLANSKSGKDYADSRTYEVMLYQGGEPKEF